MVAAPVPVYVATFMPPEILDVAQWEQTSSTIQRDLYRFFGAPARSVNVYVTANGVTEIEPDQWEDVIQVYWGGHYAFLTQAEADLLTAAGYEDRIMYAPSGVSRFSITSHSISITTNDWDILGNPIATRDHPTWPLPPIE